MISAVFGNQNVGVIAKLWFKTEEELDAFGDDEKRYLHFMRNGKYSDAEKILSKYEGEKMLYNFLLLIKECTEKENNKQNKYEIWRDVGYKDMDW